MGVEKLGHRKIIMQGIRVLCDRGAATTPAAGSASRYSQESPPASSPRVRRRSRANSAATGDNTQEESGTV